MRVTILCSDEKHPAWEMLRLWADNRYHLTSRLDDRHGDFLFLVSCTEKVPLEVRNNYQHTLVLHESDLPLNRGWSPLAWSILGGANEITVSLFEATDEIDAGPIWKKTHCRFEGHELSDEIQRRITKLKIELMEDALLGPKRVVPQQGEASYCTKRTPADSEIDPQRPLAAQFDLLRICERRFPAFFHLRGHRYEIMLKKNDNAAA